MAVFDYGDYKKYVNDWIGNQDSGGHGQLRKIAVQLNINSVVMSQVFRGDRDLTLEQALGVSKFIGQTEIERDYFLLLVQISRAGNSELKDVLLKQSEKIKQQALALKNRVQHQKFSDEDKATFYSQWYYSAIRLGISIPELSNLSSIAKYLNLDRDLAAKVIEFLLKNKLILEEKGKFNIGPQVTHVGHDSPFVYRHHNNWRLKGLQALEKNDEQNLFYTGPMALSENAAEEIRKLAIELVEKSTKKASASNSETLRCLNIDWFKIKG